MGSVELLLHEHRTWFEAPDNLAQTLVIERVKNSPHRSGEWLDCIGCALLADEWRSSA